MISNVADDSFFVFSITFHPASLRKSKKGHRWPQGWLEAPFLEGQTGFLPRNKTAQRTKLQVLFPRPEFEHFMAMVSKLTNLILCWQEKTSPTLECHGIRRIKLMASERS
ncbi:hypothetical protein CDAR_25491 [Caerostris darwini]|uniref:Uncharacterized protein n=1 Tax=Caerostris darwini TaxID=1538125 RepID=A0AAV4TX99_9ARAC|nr:hypothetical protein CDAR_25491 [Caerostris darwini]